MTSSLSSPALFSIPSDCPFLRTLAEGILQNCSDQGENLTDTRIFLPTRRSCRALRDTFLEISKGQPLLLPRMQPIGDIDADELEISLAGYGLQDAWQDIPESISPMERQFLLSRLIASKDPDLSYDQNLSLAASLTRLLDQVHTEDLDFSDLRKLVPDSLSAHWQMTLEFLEIITKNWPRILDERGKIDPADRRNRLLKKLTEFWKVSPPTTPVIAAGSTGSIPSTAAFLEVVSKLPKGAVILPGLDRSLDEESWEAIGDTHPQATMKALLERMGAHRSDVRTWPAEGSQADSPSARFRLAQAMMRPAKTFRAGKELGPESKDALIGLEIIEANSAQEEATAIAVALREVLETPGQTAALVTPDRELARRVSSALTRWGLHVDDSAGASLAASASGLFLQKIGKVIADQFASVSLLDLLKHPLTRLPESAPLVEFEIFLTRGPRPAQGIEGLRARLEAGEKIPKKEALARFLDWIEEVFSPAKGLSQEKKPFGVMEDALIRIAETLAMDSKTLWSQPESPTLSIFLVELQTYGSLLPDVSVEDYINILAHLLEAQTLRPVGGDDSRLIILGQLEARLIQADVMILGGLNEGTWPQEAGHDPWMSRPMKQDFGLPPSGRSIGLSAHDFFQGFCSSRVLITRATRIKGVQTVPSRWLQRLSAILTAEGHSPQWDTSPYLDWARVLDMPVEAFPALKAPQPCPPLATRPQELSATWIEKWVRNPYHVYANKILRLRRLEGLDEEASLADRGSFLHTVLEKFVRTYPEAMPEQAEEIFMDLAKVELSKLETRSPDWVYWEPRLPRVAEWFVSQESSWRKQASPWLIEKRGSLALPSSSDRVFTLTAKADRIDRLRDGGAVIIDYKTGSIPSLKEIRAGRSPQLPLEALILESGGFDEKVSVKDLSYWQISGGVEAGKAESLEARKTFDVRRAICEAEEALKKLGHGHLKTSKRLTLPRLREKPSSTMTKKPTLIWQEQRNGVLSL
jgi:ATP-dependent helicase/nuclease subunit B